MHFNQLISHYTVALMTKGSCRLIHNKKLILIQVARTCRVSAFFIWRKGRMYEFDILVAITAEEGFGNLREGDIAEQVFGAGVRITILGQTRAEFFQLRLD